MKNKEKTKKVLVISLIIIAILAINIFKSSNEEVEVDSVNTIQGFELLASSDFNKEEVLDMGYPTLLDIGGADCIPCKNMAHVLRELNSELMGKAIVKFIDYWQYGHLASQFEFEVIPTQFFYNENGELYKTHKGELTRGEALEIFKEMGYEFNDQYIRKFRYIN